MNSEFPNNTNEAESGNINSLAQDWREVSGVRDNVRVEVRDAHGKGDGAEDPDKKSITSENASVNEDRESLVKNSRVFVVDDDKMILMLLKMALEMKGFKNVTPFEDGEDVLDFILGEDENTGEATIPDLIVSDTQMGRMDGPEMWNQLKEALPENLLPEMVATSGGAAQSERWGQGVRFIAKPFNLSEMSDIVGKMLEARIEKKD